MSTSLLLGIHCHQPVDNFSEVLDNACLKCYKPFLEVLSEFPEFKFSIHYSGWLLEYIKKHQKDTFKLLQEASYRGSVEFFSGGYYEPILASIPRRDRIAQIKKLNSFIKRNFKQEPRGLWLTERVWDSSIIADIKACGIEYVIVDDYHFLSVGHKKENLKGYYISEDDGESIALFPIDKELRYDIPFKPSNEVVKGLEESAKKYPNSASIIFDDGEKFGIWPNTYEWVYEKEWLREFVKGVVASEEIKTTTYGEFYENNRALGNTYLPITSYFEMGEWSLKPKDAIEMEYLLEAVKNIDRNSELELDKYIKGGIWKSFFIKYEESNRIHKRVLELSRYSKGIRTKAYMESLYKAECNDVMWHGVFGGLYLPNLRDNAYRFIIDCENILHKDVTSTVLECEDIDMDGFEEAKVITPNLISIFSSKYGGQLVEFDIRDRSFNLQNTLTRRKEAYHYKIEQNRDGDNKSKDGIDSIHDMNTSKLDELKEHLKFDPFIKNSFIDHITDYSLYLNNFESSNFKEYGDFTSGKFKLEQTSKNSIAFSREGRIINGEESFDADLRKEFTFKSRTIDFNISLRSECGYSLQYLLEFNFHFANLDEIKIEKEPFEKELFLEDIERLSLYDGYLGKKISFEFNDKVNIFITRVDTISQSEAGFDHTNQALSFGFIYPFQKLFSLEGSIKVGE